jgi:lipopolysaccharide/colanic/teichoic acid biosynthesis glycosyltransferase
MLDGMRVGLVRKRLLDTALVLVTVPLWAPVLAALAVAVWLVDGCPVLFAQPRVGRGGRQFAVLKLRSMSHEADVSARKPTRLGRYLRQRGLDELPQLLNVLRGDMSLVGPRPLTPADFARLTAGHPAFAERLQLPPGLTGLAQVCGARGVALAAAVEAHYAARWTTRLDLAILLRTVWINVVGKRRGMCPLPAELA